MSRAFKCDACGEYCEGESYQLTMVPPSFHDKRLFYDLCPFCSNAVIEVLVNKEPWHDLEKTDE